MPDAVAAVERLEEPGSVIHAIALPRDDHVVAACVVLAVLAALVALVGPVLDLESDLGFVAVVGGHEAIVER